MDSIFRLYSVRHFFGARSKKPYEKLVLLREFAPSLLRNLIHGRIQNGGSGTPFVCGGHTIFTPVSTTSIHPTIVQCLGRATMAAVAPGLALCFSFEAENEVETFFSPAPLTMASRGAHTRPGQPSWSLYATCKSSAIAALGVGGLLTHRMFGLRILIL